MPTILLLDASASLLRRVVPDDPTSSRHGLLCAGALHFLSLLEQQNPLEPVSIVTFSSTADTIVPFTRDHAALRRAIESYPIRDCSDVERALQHCQNYITQSFGVTPHNVQVVLVVDGCPQPAEGGTLSAFSGGVSVHCVVLATPQELDLLPTYAHITHRSHGNIYTVALPHEAKSINLVFDKLAKTSYVGYHGVLVCGYSTASITLHPNPHTTHTHTKDDNDHPFVPEVLPIRAFVNLADVYGTPALFRYTLMTTNDKPSNFPSILRHALTAEKSAAIIALPNSRVALLSPSPNTPELILSILVRPHPGGTLSSLHSFAHCGSLGATPAALTPDTPELAWSAETVQSDFSRLHRLLRTPHKKDQAIKDCERLKRMGVMQQNPSVIVALIAVLQSSRGEAAPGVLGAIDDMIRQCSALDLMQGVSIAASTTSSNRASINSLLN